MACGGCKGGGNRHNGNGGDLTQFAYLSPRQIRYLKSIGKLPKAETPEQEKE